jgi:GNAT superfamily N-acetyltransferase
MKADSFGGIRSELPNGYEIVERPPPEMMSEVFRLRVAAWRTQSKIRAEVTHWVDDIDNRADHWAITRDGVAVGAVRLSLHNAISDLPSAEIFEGVLPSNVPPPIASYNRMVVHPAHRRRGLARVLDLICLEAARSAGASALIGASGSVEASRARIATMQSLGFRVVGIGNAVRTEVYEPTTPPIVLAYFF